MAIIPVEKLQKSGANAYEIAIIAARRARMLSELEEQPEPEESTNKERKPTVQALEELAEGKIKCVSLPQKVE